jgi:hypothetical protein
MSRGFYAADSGKGLAFAPSIKFSDFITAFEAVVADRHYTVRRIKFVRAPPTIAIDLVPIPGLKVI